MNIKLDPHHIPMLNQGPHEPCCLLPHGKDGLQVLASTTRNFIDQRLPIRYEEVNPNLGIRVSPHCSGKGEPGVEPSGGKTPAKASTPTDKNAE